MKINANLVIMILWIIAGILVLSSTHITKLDYVLVWSSYIFSLLCDYIIDQIKEITEDIMKDN